MYNDDNVTGICSAATIWANDTSHVKGAIDGMKHLVEENWHTDKRAYII